MDLVANPEDSGDLRDYLPGYPLQDDAGTRHEPDLAVSVESPEHPLDRTKWHYRNVNVVIVPQMLEVVCHVPGGRAGTILFTVDSSRKPGVACNLELEEPGKEKSDFFFLGAERKETDSVTVPIDVEQHAARVVLGCRDFGGVCVVRAFVTYADEGPPESHSMEVPEHPLGSLPSPKGNRLPSAWMRQVGQLDPEGDLDGLFDFGLPPESLGDGQRNYHEYRGYCSMGKHYRLNQKVTDGPGDFRGGPHIKDLFICDKTGLYASKDEDGAADLPPGFTRRSLKNNVFFAEYKMAIHQIRPWEMAYGLGLTYAGPVNFNGDADQCGILIRPSPVSGEEFGNAGDFFVQVSLAGKVSGGSILLDLQGMVKYFARNISEDLQSRLGERADRVVAHEVAHRTGLEHRGVVLRKWPAPVPHPRGGERPLLFWGVPGIPEHADPKRPERVPPHLHTVALRWWGPVEVFHLKREGTQRLDEREIVLERPIPESPSAPEIQKSGGVTISIFTLLVHGREHESALYELRLEAPVLPEGLVIRGHTGALMDDVGEVRNVHHQREISDEERRLMSLTRTRTFGE